MVFLFLFQGRNGSFCWVVTWGSTVRTAWLCGWADATTHNATDEIKIESFGIEKDEKISILILKKLKNFSNGRARRLKNGSIFGPRKKWQEKNFFFKKIDVGGGVRRVIPLNKKWKKLSQ